MRAGLTENSIFVRKETVNTNIQTSIIHHNYSQSRISVIKHSTMTLSTAKERLATRSKAPNFRSGVSNDCLG